jgi:hypothetical protein
LVSQSVGSLMDVSPGSLRTPIMTRTLTIDHGGFTSPRTPLRALSAMILSLKQCVTHCAHHLERVKENELSSNDNNRYTLTVTCRLIGPRMHRRYRRDARAVPGCLRRSGGHFLKGMTSGICELLAFDIAFRVRTVNPSNSLINVFGRLACSRVKREIGLPTFYLVVVLHAHAPKSYIKGANTVGIVHLLVSQPPGSAIAR